MATVCARTNAAPIKLLASHPIYVLTTVEEPKTRLAGIAAISVGVCAVRILVKALIAATLAFICGRGLAHRLCVWEGVVEG